LQTFWIPIFITLSVNILVPYRILRYNNFQSEFIGFSHPETGAHMAEILIDEAIKVESMLSVEEIV